LIFWLQVTAFPEIWSHAFFKQPSMTQFIGLRISMRVCDVRQDAEQQLKN